MIPKKEHTFYSKRMLLFNKTTKRFPQNVYSFYSIGGVFIQVALIIAENQNYSIMLVYLIQIDKFVRDIII